MEDNLQMNSPGINDENPQDKVLKKPTIKQACILFSITVLIFLFLGSKVQKREFYSGILITEFLLIMLPAVLLLLLYKYDIKKVLRLNRVGITTFLLIFGIMVFSIPVVGIFNAINLWMLKHIFGRVMVIQPPIAANLPELLLSIAVIGGSAGICEEVLFRGVIQRSFERLGAVRSILITSFLFGLMHIDFQKLLGTFMLGALIGFIVYRTNSLFSGMFAHFTNNSIAVILSYFAFKLEKDILPQLEKMNGQYSPDIDASNFTNLPMASKIIAVAMVCFIGLFCISVLIGLIVAFLRVTSQKAESIKKEINISGTSAWLWLLPGLAVIVFIYLATGLKLMGIKIEIIENIIKAIM